MKSKLDIRQRVVSTGDLPALTRSPKKFKRTKEGVAGWLEKQLRRLGSWGKRFAFVAYVNQALGRLALPKSMALFAAATWLSVRKILYDHQEPYGSRLYVSNLAGDDFAIEVLRHDLVSADGVPFAQCRDAFMPNPSMSWLQKAFSCGVWTVSRNRYTLSIFWGWTLLWRISGYLGGGRDRGIGFMKSLFPRGIPDFLFSCTRTSLLLFCFSFVFWCLVGATAESPTLQSLVGKSLTKPLTSNLIVVAACCGMSMENTHRWQSLAAFMLMSIVD